MEIDKCKSGFNLKPEPGPYQRLFDPTWPMLLNLKPEPEITFLKKVIYIYKYTRPKPETFHKQLTRPETLEFGWQISVAHSVFTWITHKFWILLGHCPFINEQTHVCVDRRKGMGESPECECVSAMCVCAWLSKPVKGKYGQEMVCIMTVILVLMWVCRCCKNISKLLLACHLLCIIKFLLTLAL